MTRSYLPALFLSVLIATTPGCQVSPDAYRDLEPSEQTLLGDRAGDRADLTNGEMPNPVGVTGITARADRYAPRHFSDLDSDCDGFVPKRPAMVVATPNELEELRISTTGEADFLIIEHADGSVNCIAGDERWDFVDSDWPAGTHRLYAGSTQRHVEFGYGVVVEDRQKPLTIPWLTDEELFVADTVGQLEKPLQWSFTRKAGESTAIPPLVSAPDCLDDDFDAGSHPAGLLRATEDSRIDLVALTDEKARLVVVGPLTEDGRDVPVKCMDSRGDELSISAGDHLVYLAVEPTQTPVEAELILRDSNTDVDPRYLATVPGEELPVASRALQHHYPFLSANTLWYSDALRARFFSAAPPELFVALAEDIEEVETFVATDRNSGHLHRSVDGARLHAGEVALLIDDAGHILTSDQMIVAVDHDLLIPLEELDEPHLVESPRPVSIQPSEALSLATGDDRDQIRDYQRRQQQYEFCRDDLYHAVDAEIEELAADGAPNHEIDELVDRAESRVRRECDESGLRSAATELQQQLEQSRTERRRQALDQHRERIEILRDND